VEKMNQRVAVIAASAAEQATGLKEVNAAMNQMDQVTQQNAAMVEQSTAASHALAQESANLTALVQRFSLREGVRPAGRRRLGAGRPSLKRRPAARVPPGFAGRPPPPSLTRRGAPVPGVRGAPGLPG
jgi:methyl-accepting chemotaxis protein